MKKHPVFLPAMLSIGETSRQARNKTPLAEKDTLMLTYKTHDYTQDFMG